MAGVPTRPHPDLAIAQATGSFPPPRSCRHLKDLLKDDERTKALSFEAEDLYLDLSRQNATPQTLQVCGGGGGCLAEGVASPGGQ